MNSRRAILPAVVLALLLGSGQSADVWDSWLNPDFDKRGFHKMMIIGISEDRVRNSFEDKFVSHLRGRGYDGMISYRLAPDLHDPPDRDKVLEAIADKNVDGAITVRVVPLDKQHPADKWISNWLASLYKPVPPRELIRAALATNNPKAKKLGLEVSLWDTDGEEAVLVWAARSRVLKRKELEEGASRLVDMVMNKLWDADLLRGSGG